MKFKIITIFALIASTSASADQASSMELAYSQYPSSPIISSLLIKENDQQPLSCKTDSLAQSPVTKTAAAFPQTFNYLNDEVKLTYNTMRNGVISHVTIKVALSLLDFNVDGFSAENIAGYVTEGTKPFLPFEFANGVKITKVTPKGNTIIYRAEMPITKNHSLAAQLALAGKQSAATTICNDMEMVDDLLGRDILIQYDYYDSNGEFFRSFTING